MYENFQDPEVGEFLNRLRSHPAITSRQRDFIDEILSGEERDHVLDMRSAGVIW